MQGAISAATDGQAQDRVGFPCAAASPLARSARWSRSVAISWVSLRAIVSLASAGSRAYDGDSLVSSASRRLARRSALSCARLDANSAQLGKTLAVPSGSE